MAFTAGAGKMYKSRLPSSNHELRHVAIMARASSTYRPEATSIFSKSWSMASRDALRRGGASGASPCNAPATR